MIFPAKFNAHKRPFSHKDLIPSSLRMHTFSAIIFALMALILK